MCLACYRLAVILAGAVPWPAWRGWQHQAGALHPPGTWRQGFEPHHLHRAQIAFQQVAALREALATATRAPVRYRLEISAGGAAPSNAPATRAPRARPSE